VRGAGPRPVAASSSAFSGLRCYRFLLEALVDQPVGLGQGCGVVAVGGDPSAVVHLHPAVAMHADGFAFIALANDGPALFLPAVFIDAAGAGDHGQEITGSEAGILGIVREHVQAVFCERGKVPFGEVGHVREQVVGAQHEQRAALRVVAENFGVDDHARAAQHREAGPIGGQQGRRVHALEILQVEQGEFFSPGPRLHQGAIGEHRGEIIGLQLERRGIGFFVQQPAVCAKDRQLVVETVRVHRAVPGKHAFAGVGKKDQGERDGHMLQPVR